MPTKRKRGVPKNRTNYDMQRYYKSLDLAALWADFYVSISPSGLPKYKSSKQFARAVGENDQQVEFLIWLFGPDGDAEANALFPYAKPLDFDSKRSTKGWFTEDNLRAYSKEVRGQLNALEALRTAGNGITINSLARMEKLARQLDQDFGGTFFVDGLSFKENLARGRVYLMMHEKLLRMIGEAQDIYAKSHGINFQDMSGFERLVAAQALALSASATVKTSRSENVLAALVQLVMEKGAKHGLAIPGDVAKMVIDAPPQKKKPVTM